MTWNKEKTKSRLLQEAQRRLLVIVQRENKQKFAMMNFLFDTLIHTNKMSTRMSADAKSIVGITAHESK